MSTNGNGHAPSLPELREQVERLNLQGELARLRRLAESTPGPLGPGLGPWLDPFADRARDEGWGGPWLPLGGLGGKRGGAYRPFVWTDVNLDFMRAQAEALATRNPFAVGAIGTLTNYTVRTGFSYEARPGRRFGVAAAALALARQVQDFVEDFQSLNTIGERGDEQFCWADRERQCLWRGVVKGEVALRVFDQGDTTSLVRPIDSEQIRQPPDADPHYLLGIKTALRDVERREEFCVYYDETEPEYVPACEVAFQAWNVPSNVKRGLSDFYSTADAFDGTVKLLSNMREAGAIQAAIAWVEKYSGASAATLGQLATQRRDQGGRADVTDPATNRRIDYQRFHPGSVSLTNEFKEYLPGPLAANTTQHVQILAACLRSLARRWDMPEYMMSADACLSEDSEVLTPRGWVGLDDLGVADAVGTVNPRTGALEYQVPTRHYCSRRRGPMVHVRSRTFDLLVTPNHDVYLSKMLWRREEWRKVPAEDLLSWPHAHFKCLSHVRWESGHTPPVMHIPGLGARPAALLLQFLGIYMGDGGISASGHRVAVAGISRPRKLRYYEPILSELGFKLHVDEGGRHHWYVDNAELHGWIKAHVGTSCETKRLPPLVWALDAGGLAEVWAGLLNSDGNRSPGREYECYSSTSRGLADDVQILCLRMGRCAAVSECPPGQLGKLPVYKVNVSPGRVRALQPGNVRQVEYEGRVWCVTVPNGLIVSRRNGKVAVSGNSNAAFASTLVAGSPFVTAVECRQAEYGRYFVRVLWMAVRNAARRGRFVHAGHVYDYGEISRMVDIVAVPPQVAIADKRQEAEIDWGDMDRGLLSGPTRAARRGLDLDTEEANNKKHPLTRQPGRASDLDAAGNPKAPQKTGPPEPDVERPQGGQGPVREEARVSEALAEALFRTLDDISPEAQSALLREAAHWREAERLQEASAGAGHEVGDVWQGPSKRWFTRRADGRVVPAKAPGGEGKPAGKPRQPKATVDEVHDHVQQLQSKGRVSAQEAHELAGHILQLSVKEAAELKQRLGLKASGTKYEVASKLAAKALKDANAKRGQKKETDRGRPERAERAGAGGVPGAAAGAGGPVEGPDREPALGAATQGGHGATAPAGGKTAGRVPAETGEVIRRVERFEKLFDSRGQHHVADWLRALKDHVGAVGGEAALAALGPEKAGVAGDPVQYWGVGTEESNWKNMGQFMEAYLARHGVIAVTGETSAPDSPLISALGKPDRFVAGQDFKPASDAFKNKLDEAKHLPGLEASEDVGTLMGRPVTHLTADVTAKLDEKYGAGKWIVKCYTDEAAAGYGIFFPQRAQAVVQDARGAIWDSGGHLARYGFSHLRDDKGTIVGIKHSGGDEYRFGTEKYQQTIQGDARHWADRAAAAAHHENGAMLPEGNFMAQPAFPAVGISDAERAAGKTWHESNEGRVHLVTRPDGSVEPIAHATWLKGGNLPVVFENDDTRAMARAAADAVNALPPEARKGQVYAPDVMKTADGYRVVELNAQGDHNGSGYLHDNHFTIDAYTSHLTGREPLHVSFLRKLLTTRAGHAT